MPMVGCQCMTCRMYEDTHDCSYKRVITAAYYCSDNMQPQQR